MTSNLLGDEKYPAQAPCRLLLSRNELYFCSFRFDSSCYLQHLTDRSVCLRNIVTVLLYRRWKNVKLLFCVAIQKLACFIPYWEISWILIVTFTNWIGHILRINCFLHYAIEGQMTEVKGVRKRWTQLLDDLRNRKRYWALEEEAEDCNRYKQQFINRI